VAKKDLTSELTEQQLDELLAYTPTFSDENNINIKTRFLEETSSKEETRRMTMKKFFISTAAAIMILVTSTAVFAAVTNFNLGQMFSSFFNNANVADRFDVGKTVVREDIEITVVSVYTDGTQVYAILEIRDLQGGRLSDNTALIFDNRYYHAHIVAPVDYNETTDTVLVGINIDYQLPLDSQIAFTIDYLLSGARHVMFEPIAFPIALHALERDMITRTEWDEAASQGQIADGGTNSMVGIERVPQLFLNIGEISETLPNINWAIISNIGFHDGFLHIQTRRTESWNPESNFGHLHLLDSNGEPVWSVFSLNRGEYTENVFDIGSVDSLDEMTLTFVGMTVNAVIPGPWAFDFPIATQADRITTTFELQNSQHFSHIDVNVSPMSTSIQFFAINETDSLELVGRMRGYVMDFGNPFITLKDGSIIELFSDSVMFGNDGGLAEFNSFFFDITQIYSITILGEEHLIYA